MNMLVDWMVRPSLVLAIGLLVVAFLRRQPAAVRHWILAATIGLAAIQPLVTPVMPTWRVPGVSWRQADVTPPSVAARPRTEISFEFLVPPTSPPVANWMRTAIRVWLGGVAIGLGVILSAMGWLTMLGQRASKPGRDWVTALESLQARLGVARRVRIAITQHPAMLVTWGAISPAILLPAGADSWALDRKQLVVAHEIAHLKRHDWLIQLLAETARAIFWFNPLFWIACARLRHESECASDDLVLETGIAGTAYASHLVDLARSFSVHGRTWLPAPSIARPSTLERRVRAMLNSRLNRRPLSAHTRIALVALMLAIALPIAAASHRSGSPAGTLRDPQGRVLPAATVRLSAIGTEAIHETQTDAMGAFQFPEIPDGEYMLSARLPGFVSMRQRVRITSANAPIDMTLQVGTLHETISVSGTGIGSQEGAPLSPAKIQAAMAAPRCGTTEVGGNLKPPMKLKDVRPRYPQSLIDGRVEANILMQALIGVDGRVRNVEVVSPVNPDLEEEAIRAVSQWEFSPTWLNCQAIEVRMFVNVSFKIDR